MYITKSRFKSLITEPVKHIDNRAVAYEFYELPFFMRREIAIRLDIINTKETTHSQLLKTQGYLVLAIQKDLLFKMMDLIIEFKKRIPSKTIKGFNK